ncbi:hypothetical protein DFH09DRAFT_1092785 [Mycena vulgaris]|nr:hypothetical protein DFH09DRAFT_1092785 [Mycena vulgaris]
MTGAVSGLPSRPVGRVADEICMRDGYGTAKSPSMPSTCGQRPLTAAYGLASIHPLSLKFGKNGTRHWCYTVEHWQTGQVLLDQAGYQLKGRYKIMKEMLVLLGFGYDAKTKSVTATEEVWDAYLALFTAVDQTQELMIDRFLSVKIDRHQPVRPIWIAATSDS